LELENSEAFIRLISFDRGAKGALTLFHCPLIPVTGSSYVVMFPAMLMSRITTCINRLAVHRGVGYNSFSKEIEQYYLELIKQHYAREGVLVRTNIAYTCEGIDRDIDLVAYEVETKRLLAGMLKAFINPDTVEEVIRCNEQLAYGIEQARDAQKWLTSTPPDRRSELLGLPPGLPCETIQYAVLGNGFAGSDYLPLEASIPVADANYLLRPRLRGGSIIDSIAEYNAQLSAMAPAPNSAKLTSLTLGDITFHFPAYEVSPW
jgi:hypothetical protein